MFIQIHKPKSTGEMISLERRLYEVVQKEWDSQEPIGHSFAQQTQKDVSTAFYWYWIYKYLPQGKNLKFPLLIRLYVNFGQLTFRMRPIC